jgi:Tfp pilus assembly protein PilO
MILREKTQRFFYGLLLGLIVLNLPIYIFFVRPEKVAASLEAERIEQAQRDLRDKLATIKMLKGIEERLAESHRTQKKFESQVLFPRNKVSSGLIKELDEVCVQAGLVRNRVAFSPAVESDYGYQQLSVTLPVEGSYSNIRKFLNVLESRPRLIIVDSMELASEREGTGMVQMDMNLSTYYPVHP